MSQNTLIVWRDKLIENIQPFQILLYYFKKRKSATTMIHIFKKVNCFCFNFFSRTRSVYYFLCPFMEAIFVRAIVFFVFFGWGEACKSRQKRKCLWNTFTVDLRAFQFMNYGIKRTFGMCETYFWWVFEIKRFLSGNFESQKGKLVELLLDSVCGSTFEKLLCDLNLISCIRCVWE